MNIVLIEFPDEVESFLAHCRNRGVKPTNFHIVALWPNVHVVLRQHNIPYTTTRPYFDNDSHQRIVFKSEEWLKTIEASIGITDGLGLTETYNSSVIFHLRFYI